MLPAHLLHLLALAPALQVSPNAAPAQNPALSSEELRARIERLADELAQERAERQERERALLELVDATGRPPAAPGWADRLSLGGYGEVHFNQREGPGGEQIDLHRAILYLGYRFSDWVRLQSETELEHGFVGEEGDGELGLEQLHVDFQLAPGFGVRAGRSLTPLGIVNRFHEPTVFHGVERPLFDTVVIPTTWSADGVGIYGTAGDAWSYELYVQSSLDGSRFGPVSGIRGGRQKGTPGLSQPALSGRLDWSTPLDGLRLGLSGFAGGLDNGAGGTNPGVDAALQIASADFQWSLARFDLRGAYAFENIDGAGHLPVSTASEIEGWDLEVAWRCLPPSWRTGRLAQAEAALFVRYDSIDTQKGLPAGAARDPRGARDEITFGVSFFPVQGLVLKADYQIRDDDSEAGLPERFNAGIGWSF